MTAPMSDSKGAAIDERKCSKCGEVKPVSEYSFDSRPSRGTLHPNCKMCASVNARDWYERNKVKKLAQSEEYRKSHWERIKKLAYERRKPEEQKARQAVNNAVAAGRFEKQPCGQCDEPKADFHHNNGYDKENWFTGVWLCRKHHAQTHKELRWKTQ